MSEEKKVRRIYIPEDVSFPVLAGGKGPQQKYPYSYFIEFLLNAGKTFNQSSQGARMAVHVDNAFRNAKTEGTAVEVEGAEGGGREYFDLEQKPQPQWQALKEAVENPGAPYPIPGRYLIPYIDSVVDAEEVPKEE